MVLATGDNRIVAALWGAVMSFRMHRVTIPQERVSSGENTLKGNKPTKSLHRGIVSVRALFVESLMLFG
jgi:hypothetical protein